MRFPLYWLMLCLPHSWPACAEFTFMSYLATNTPRLVRWIESQPTSAFPAGGLPYKDRLANVFNYLQANVYSHVQAGAILSSVDDHDDQSASSPLVDYLTDHGEQHIRTVIARAGDLIFRGDVPSLRSYEVYLLIQAAHFHDVGNIFGRGGHEKRLADVIAALGPLVGDDAPERRAIQRIAGAHGGKVNGSKDTVGLLPPVEPVLGQEVRFQALAAILRFADELADDSTRAGRFMMASNQIPESSQVFHRYALALHSVIVKPEHHTIQLDFQFTRDDAVREFGKFASRVYLLDEIFARTLKMHCERMYCMRFMRDIARMDAIDVRITIYQDNNSIVPLMDPIGYRLTESGYPDFTTAAITDFCPDLTLTGRALCDSLLNSH